jgi:hypothetical protein
MRYCVLCEDDAIKFSNEKNPLEGKVAIPWIYKEDLATFPKAAEISFETKVHISNGRESGEVEIGGYTICRLPQI